MKRPGPAGAFFFILRRRGLRRSCSSPSPSPGGRGPEGCFPGAAEGAVEKESPGTRPGLSCMAAQAGLRWSVTG